MNINDTQSDIILPEFPWLAMYQIALGRQESYHQIEKDIGYGLLTNLDDFDIDQKNSQYLLKDFKWRVWEEITEAIEAKSEGHSDEHFKEELIDALVFFLNLLCLLKIEPENMFEGSSDRTPGPDAFLTVGTLLGLAGNCLKNKPWKQSQMVTDRKKYYFNIQLAFAHYQDLLLRAFDNDLLAIYSVYVAKQKVNDFRVESQY